MIAVPGLLRRTVPIGRLMSWPVAVWLFLVLGGILARPPIALEATAFSAAWQMRLAGLPLPPPIGERIEPPLLYWLIDLGWSLFGVSETWARLVAPLFGLGALLLMRPLARLLWPERPETGRFAALLLAGAGGFAAYAGFALPDLPLLFFGVLGMLGLALAWRGRAVGGWALYGLALGGAFLAKGSAGWLLLLPAGSLAPLWAARWRAGWGGWLLGLAGALALAALLALLWLVPALQQGEAAARAALLGPAAGAEPGRPVYWYAVMVPLMLYPWLWWRTLWRAARRRLGGLDEPPLRLAAAAGAGALAAALLTGQGQAHALLPLLPPLALLGARLLVAEGGKARDFHAVIPGLAAVLVGLVFFLFNIVPVAHLDVVWREFVSDESLPIWLGGISFVSGFLLLGGSLVLAQMTPRALFARTLQLALLPTLLVASFNLEFAISLKAFFDLEPMARAVAALQEAGRPVAIVGAYHGELAFAGRLAEPLTELPDAAAALAWTAAHPDGVVISYFKGSLLHLPARPLYLGPAGDHWAALWPSVAVAATDGAVLSARF